MRHLHSESHFCHALYALQDPDGYVDALLEIAREQSVSRNSTSLRAPTQKCSLTLTRTNATQRRARFH